MTKFKRMGKRTGFFAALCWKKLGQDIKYILQRPNFQIFQEPMVYAMICGIHL